MLQAAAETAAWQRDGGASVAGQQQTQAAAGKEDATQRRERQRVEQLTLACMAAQKERSALQQILESKVWTGVSVCVCVGGGSAQKARSTLQQILESKVWTVLSHVV